LRSGTGTIGTAGPVSSSRLEEAIPNFHPFPLGTLFPGPVPTYAHSLFRSLPSYVHSRFGPFPLRPNPATIARRASAAHRRGEAVDRAIAHEAAVHTHRYSRVLTGTHGDSRGLTGTHGYSRGLTGTHRYSRVLTGTHGYSRVLTGTQTRTSKPHAVRTARPSRRRVAARATNVRMFALPRCAAPSGSACRCRRWRPARAA
jgi:hypothetical protein